MADAPTEPPRRRPPPRPVEVVRTERLSPHFTRVTLGGPALEGFALTAATTHIKLFLPGPGEREPALPEWGPDGPVWPEGRAPAVVRTYTPRRFDPDRLELDVELYLHGNGPASRWGATAGPGDRAAVAGPGRGYQVDPAAEWLLLAGDEPGIPAIAAIVEHVPAGIPVIAVLEVGDPDDRVALPDHDPMEVVWVVRGDQPGGALLEGELRRLELPEGAGRAWVATESTVVRRIRRHLLTERGLPPTSVVTRGYWKAGEADHPDHDFGEG